jgi:hypothetical protein
LSRVEVGGGGGVGALVHRVPDPPVQVSRSLSTV